LCVVQEESRNSFLELWGSEMNSNLDHCIRNKSNNITAVSSSTTAGLMNHNNTNIFIYLYNFINGCLFLLFFFIVLFYLYFVFILYPVFFSFLKEWVDLKSFFWYDLCQKFKRLLIAKTKLNLSSFTRTNFVKLYP
jgi:hypothetical protein